MRTEQLLKQSQALAEELQSQQLQLQKTNAELQEKAQLLAEQKTEVETKNQRSGAGQEGAGRKGRAAGAHFQVQERISGQHEPRAAHAAQQPADSGAHAVGELGQEPEREAGEVRRDHSHFGNRPAGADQRHSGSEQDRIGQDGRGSGRRPLQRAAKITACARSATWPTARGWTSRSIWVATWRPRSSIPTPSACSRCSRTCFRTR